MKELFSYDTCTGCGACANICPKDCIELVEQKEGFKYPKINQEHCINCGQCIKVCPINKSENHSDELVAYGAYTKDAQVRKESSSGGLFSAIALEILNNKGVVFGAAISDDNTVCHSKVEKEEDLYKLRGSKYVQSNINYIYRELKKEADSGKEVLFMGTPCQVAGARAFLNHAYDNVLFGEFICHGVPSESLWKKYLEFIKKRYRDNIKEIYFRNKKYGWKQQCMTIHFSSGKKYVKRSYYDLWYRVFQENICLRKSCHGCKFRIEQSMADFCLGDFWGCSVVAPEMDGEEGTSLVIVKTQKGQDILRRVSDRIILNEVDFKECALYNKALIQPEKAHPLRKDFLEEQNKLEFKQLVEKYCPISFSQIVKKEIFCVVKMILKKVGVLEQVKKMKKR